MPKRRFGQHFLRDTAVIDRIVRLVQPACGDLIVEIGAGTGVLTSRLASQACQLVAIEVDRDRIPALERTLAAYPQASIIAGDILQIDLSALLVPYLRSGCRIRVVGNLPYNIATVIIERFFSSNIPVFDMVLMVQLEVAERIVSFPGSRQYGYISVRCQHVSHARMHFRVPSSSFFPNPKVQSAVISLRMKNTVRENHFPEDLFLELIKAAFAHRRKTLLNSLRRHPNLGSIAGNLLQRAGIDGQRRAEDLAVEEYETLAVELRALRGQG